jgi:hypothetical protein
LVVRIPLTGTGITEIRLGAVTTFCIDSSADSTVATKIIGAGLATFGGGGWLGWSGGGCGGNGAVGKEKDKTTKKWYCLFFVKS